MDQGAVTLVVDRARACEKGQLKVVCPGASLGKRKHDDDRGKVW